MFDNDPVIQVLFFISGILLSGLVVLYCWDIWTMNKYCFYRHCSCKKRAKRVIVPEALVTSEPITLVVREVIAPKAIII